MPSRRSQGVEYSVFRYDLRDGFCLERYQSETALRIGPPLSQVWIAAVTGKTASRNRLAVFDWENLRL